MMKTYNPHKNIRWEILNGCPIEGFRKFWLEKAYGNNPWGWGEEVARMDDEGLIEVIDEGRKIELTEKGEELKKTLEIIY